MATSLTFAHKMRCGHSNQNPNQNGNQTKNRNQRNDLSEDLPLDFYLSKRLSDMLGFVKIGPFAAGDRKSECPADTEDVIHNLYVYCDLIEPVPS